MTYARIQNTQLTGNTDGLIWRWQNNGKFTTHSAYEWLVFRGMTQELSTVWWELRIPLKIKVFMWLTGKKKILTRDNLAKRGWQGVPACSFCSEIETVDHLFVQCEFVRKVWFWMGICQDLSIYWHNMDDVLIYAQSLPRKERNAFLTVLSAVCWSMWQCRNTIIFKHKQCRSIRNLIILICSFLNYWSGLFKSEEQLLIKRWMPQDLDLIPLQCTPPVLCLTG
jgi:zinc-binding in reverse transcriptase